MLVYINVNNKLTYQSIHLSGHDDVDIAQGQAFSLIYLIMEVKVITSNLLKKLLNTLKLGI